MPATGQLWADPQLRSAAIGRGEGSGGSVVHSLSTKQHCVSHTEFLRCEKTQTLMIDTT